MKTIKCSTKSISSITLHKKRPFKHVFLTRIDLLILFLALLISIWSCYSTAGKELLDVMNKKIQFFEKEVELNNNNGILFCMKDIVELVDFIDLEPNKKEELIGSWWGAQPTSWYTELKKKLNENEELPYNWQPDFWSLFSIATVLSIIILWNFSQLWSMRINVFLNYIEMNTIQTSEFIKVIPHLHKGKSELVPLFSSNTSNPFFYFQKLRYEYNSITHSFDKVKFLTNQPINFYINSTGISSDAIVEEKKRIYGPNKFDIPLPNFKKMYIDQVTSPFFVFQIFCIALWCLEEYWQFSLFSLVMLLSFEAGVVHTRRSNILKLRGMGNKKAECEILRNGNWSSVSTEELVPGDVIRLQSGKNNNVVMPCDCLLLKGIAVVNEATLTGESIPLLKDSISPSNLLLDVKNRDKLHLLYGGTNLMESRSSDGKITCYVLCTGFASSQGKLVRKIEFSTEKVTEQSYEAGLLLFFLLFFAILSSGYFLYHGTKDKTRTRFELLLHCILIITSVVPQDLPMQLSMAVNASLSALMALEVFCIEPFRIPISGIVSVCCFDKTGMLFVHAVVYCLMLFQER